MVPSRQKFPGHGIAAAIQQFLHERIRVVLRLGGGGNDGRDGRLECDKDRVGVRQLADFSRRQRDAFAGGDNGEQRAEVLDVVPEVRGEARGLAAGADGGVAAGDSVEEVLEEYPSLTREDVKACLDYASKLMGNHYSVVPVT